MSRIGKQPVEITNGVEVKINGTHVSVKGAKGSLEFTFHPRMKISMVEKTIVVERQSEEKLDKSLHGITRTLISNMVEGVTKGFERALEIQGVGYRVAMKGKDLDLSLGFSHPVVFKAPDGISFEIDKDKKNIFRILGINKEVVGQTAAKIRSLRPPEPYKGKGIRYLGENVKRKAGKAASAAK
ncbi:50S ribosomal protein L6 [Candidatus Gracilibacteria bacterium]|nr:50S ribosomal protein L6 [Candidatus Gracilibacteria bacterium]